MHAGPLTILRDLSLGLPSLLMLLWPGQWRSLDARVLARPDFFTDRFHPSAAPPAAARLAR
jgi:hypothetical protein